MNSWTMMKRPSAFLPVAMSLAALATVLGHVAMFGAAREADEGAAAHTFQLLLIAQVPIVAFFAIKWLRRARDRRFPPWPCKPAPRSQHWHPSSSSTFKLSGLGGVAVR